MDNTERHVWDAIRDAGIRFPRFVSIRSRLMVLAVVAVAPLLALIVFGVLRQNEREHELRQTQAHEWARFVAQHIDEELGHLDGLLVGLAPVISARAADVPGNEERLVAVQKDLRSHILSIEAYAVDGAPLGSSTRLNNMVPARRELIDAVMARKELSVGEPETSRTDGLWTLTLARPLPDTDGKPVGIVGVVIDLVRLGLLLKEGEQSLPPELSADPVLSVIDQKRITIARSVEPARFIGKQNLDPQVVDEMLAAREGTREFSNSLGERRLAGFSICRRAPWLVYARVSSDAAFAQARSNLRVAIFWGAGSLALAMGLAWLISVRITRPIRQLSSDAAALGSGQRLPLRVVESQGEVGVLARSFNEMLTNLAERDTELRRLNESLRQRVSELQTLFDLMPVGVGIAVDATGRDIRMNHALALLFGLPPDRNASLTAPPDEAPHSYLVRKNGRDLRGKELPIQRALAENVPVTNFEHTIVREDGVEVEVLLDAVPLRDSEGKVRGCVATFQDLTALKQNERERLAFERKLLETQKLESLGVLAGGIAHDFNNLLTSILGNASLASLDLPPSSPIQTNLEYIREGSVRAADLCKQMLAYSGKGRFVVQKVDLNAFIEETTHLLRLSISKQAVLRFNLSPALPLIEADVTQIRQVIMNLVINASEAIGARSGVIGISTGLARVDRAYLGDTLLSPDLPEGNYVYLEVSDNGCGMSPETQAKIFEPFFTTKFAGRGLGLAAVLGIVRGHKGALKVYSEPGKGTTFKLLFPCAAGSAEAVASNDADAQAWRGQGRVLVADDEETVRTTAALMLKKLGFETELAVDGSEAVAVFQGDPARYALVLLDLTMPHLDGEQVFAELRRLRPEVRVVLMSGFSEQEVAARFTGKGPSGFLQKPFALEALREVLQALFAGEPAAESIQKSDRTKPATKPGRL